MYWVLQSNVYNEDGFKRLTDVLERMELPHSIHKVVPFEGRLEPDPQPTQKRVMVMGTYTMARIAKQRGWIPGAFVNENFDFTVQLQHWGEKLLNSDAVVCRLIDVPEQVYPFFIRPIFDSKSFTGQVMDWPEFVEWRDRAIETGKERIETQQSLAFKADTDAIVTGDTLVQVCYKKQIYREYRTWIVDRQVVTSSLYKIGTRKTYSGVVDQQIEDFAASVARRWCPASAFVLDVAETPDGLFVMEPNNINAAGFYEADMGKLVDALESKFGSGPVWW